ncbi:hypothetical protein [Leisingera sp. M523]|uniref:hypothetical protein n=1 Tax=Leisingera sp. M523 TaxID=2867013 RepID=UPI0021A684E0|nr:hypothetical protein [Leisingera sp. M523]UWQ27705.1 hypothetical protein K3557_12950 [Leisingera sp. M523]
MSTLPVAELVEFARREGRRRELKQAAVGAVVEALELSGGDVKLNLRNVIRMLDRGEAMERAAVLH